MKQNETIKNLDDFFNSEESRQFLKGGYERVRACFDMMKDHIKILTADKQVDKIDKKLSIETISTLKHIVLFSPVSPAQVKFLDNWVLVCQNWASNIEPGHEETAHFKDIKTEYALINRLVHNITTARETTELLKAVLSRLHNFREWNPPAFEISKSVLDALTD